MLLFGDDTQNFHLLNIPWCFLYQLLLFLSLIIVWLYYLNLQMTLRQLTQSKLRKRRYFCDHCANFCVSGSFKNTPSILGVFHWHRSHALVFTFKSVTF